MRVARRTARGRDVLERHGRKRHDGRDRDGDKQEPHCVELAGQRRGPLGPARSRPGGPPCARRAMDGSERCSGPLRTRLERAEFGLHPGPPTQHDREFNAGAVNNPLRARGLGRVLGETVSCGRHRSGLSVRRVHRERSIKIDIATDHPPRRVCAWCGQNWKALHSSVRLLRLPSFAMARVALRLRLLRHNGRAGLYARPSLLRVRLRASACSGEVDLGCGLAIA